jgi:hypothetical protein
MRVLDNPRFSGAGRFKPDQILACLCEDLVTKADIGWFTDEKRCAREIQIAVLPESGLIDELKLGRVRVHVDDEGRAMIKSSMDSMAWRAELHRKLYKKAGFVADEPSQSEIRTAERSYPRLGVGWQVSQLEEGGKLRPLTWIEEESKYSDTDSEHEAENLRLEHEKWCGVDHPDYPPTPSPSRASSPLVVEEKGVGVEPKVWLFVQNGQWTVWRELGVVVTGKTLWIKKWKNQHPSLSRVLDLVLVLIAIFLAYLAVSKGFEWCRGYLRSWYSGAASDLGAVREGRGLKSNFVKKAEGRPARSNKC